MVQLQATYHMYKDSVDTLPIYIVGDSQSALLALKGGSKDVHLRSVFLKCLDLCCELVDKYDKVDLRFVWAQARLNVADLNSKIHGDVVQLTNGDKWRHGPEEFKDKDFMDKHTFLTFNKITKSFTPTSNSMPSIKDDVGSCMHDKVSMNPDASTPESLTTKISTVHLLSQPVKSECQPVLDKVKVSKTPYADPSATNTCLTPKKKC